MSIATEIQRIQTAKADIKTAIEAKGVTVDEAAKIDTYASKVDEVYDAGYEKGKSEGGGDNYYDTFWDAFQKNGEVMNYNYAFAYSRFNDESYNPKYTIKALKTASQSAHYVFYQNDAITDTKVDIDVSNGNACNFMFAYCNKLKTIKKIISGENSSFYNTFVGCSNLVNLTFEGVLNSSINLGAAKLLSNESVQSIINCLGDMTGKDPQTLTLHANIKSNLTDEQKATITNKNWTLA